MTLLFVFIFISIFVSFLCSILEAVVLSITPSYLASIEKTNEKLFKKLSPLLLNIERPLAAILSLNTFAHTIGATGAGAQVQKVFGDSVLTIFSILLTFAILFLSEIIPKSIGARHWKKLIPFIGYILPTFIFLTLPLVWLSESISKAIKGEHEKLTRDEIHAVAEIGVRDGAIFPEEFEALKNMLSFPKKPIKDITLAIEKVFTLPLSTPQEELLNICEQYKFSRIPIVGTYEYDVRGYVLRCEILSSLLINEQVGLSELLKPMLQVTEDTKIRNVFTKLIKRKEHIASVHSEGGDLVGIVTLEDIIEEILGLDIKDETDN
ncbi:CNNM domain-containing protein [Halobacteriovorax sp. JY17]|uniref:CNNM domain-containing protein n=1 Tax=Halobacteriovorax sp. JY17 TaxID=2014617 RepID=UPI000C56849A|nr:CNNM domain-containing protein [Halobacteriovorax sp. JY17]PIK15679.1 MAG: hemolysin [Halobacteriovorax sp. JY17]